MLTCTLCWSQLIRLPGTCWPYTAFYSAFLIVFQEIPSYLLHSLETEDRFSPWFFVVAAMLSWRFCWANEAHCYACSLFWYQLWSSTSCLTSCPRTGLCIWGPVLPETYWYSLCPWSSQHMPLPWWDSANGEAEDQTEIWEVSAHEANPLEETRAIDYSLPPWHTVCRLRGFLPASTVMFGKTLARSSMDPLSSLSLPCFSLSCLLTAQEALFLNPVFEGTLAKVEVED